MSSNDYLSQRSEITKLLIGAERICDLILDQRKFIHPREQQKLALLLKQNIETLKTKQKLHNSEEN